MPVKAQERLCLILALLLLALVFLFLLKYLFPILAPFIFGLALAYLIKRPVKFIQCRLGFSRRVAVMVVLVITVVAVGLLLTFCLARLYQEVRSLLSFLPEQVGIWSARVERLSSKIATWLRVPGGFWEFSKLKPENYFATVSSLLQGALNLGKRFPTFLFQFFFSGLAAYFFSRDQEKIQQSFIALFPDRWQKTLLRTGREILRSVFGYINLQLRLGTVTAFLSILRWWLFGLPRPWLFGLLLGLLDLLPVFGPALLYLPWIGWELATGDLKTLLVLVIIFLVTIGVRQFLEIRLVGEKIGVHPLLVLLALYLGVKIMGGFGVLGGPFLVIMIRSCYQGITSFAHEKVLN
ncbi:MAG: AI-2E family transporter [Firmicutes bacterium]|nr:AI-2E family transporter [Bacillota bacterium]